MSNRVHVVTDSACDLPAELAQAEGIQIVPLTIRFGDEEFVDGRDLTSEQFWDKMSTAADLPSTAAPSPGAFEQAFRRASESGASGVVCINLSSKLSATYQAAVAAKRAVEGEIDVRVVDSELCTVAQAVLCLEAARAAALGTPIDEIETLVQDLKARTRIFGALDTVDNLRKGGRIGAANAFFGSLLAIKPLITFREGEVEAESRQRTRSKALAHLADLVTSAAPVGHVAVSHSGAPDLDMFLELLAPVATKEQILVVDIGPVIGTHGGPRLVAVSFIPEPASETTSAG